uniref:spectrin beta chain, non-erythrocytic 1 n=1 Tax=Lonchura striata TaxID=40157 RepID=UPI00129343FA|nr:spectrin beta chain, non-erythrocytic 1 [Lonchura striata domestica]
MSCRGLSARRGRSADEHEAAQKEKGGSQVGFGVSDEREAVQKKTFTKWVNSHLAQGSHLGDLYSDLRDGRLLLRLLEGLSGETLVRIWGSDPPCPTDVAVEQPDERSVLTYVAALYHHFSRMKALAVEGKRVGKVLEAAREAEGLAGRYEAQAAELLGWIQRSLLLLTDRRLPRGIPGLQGQLQAFSAYRTTEKPPRIESDIAAYGSRVRAVTAVAAELEAERYHDMGGIATRRDHVVSLWEALRAQVAARRERLRAHLELQRLLRDLEHLMGWMEEMEVRLQSRDFGQHLSQVDDLLQIHALVEGDVAAQAERVRSVGAAAERFLGEGGGYRPCPPEQLRARVAALELRYRGLSALSEQRRLRLERSRRLWKFLWDAGEEEAWMREQERLLRCPELGRDLPGALRMLSQLEAIRGLRLSIPGILGHSRRSRRFETLEPELAALAARVASVGRVTQELQGSGDRNRESARETWEQLRDRWERFRALAERKKVALTAALNIHNFRLECHETRGWMREKTAAIEATRALGRDLAGITALQGKLSGMGRDLDAIQGKLRELRAEAEKLQGEQPERAPEIREGLAGLEAEWDALRRCHRSREESLGQARRLQGFLRDLAALQAWLSRTRAAAGSEDVPASLAEAEGSLRQHESLRTEISHYGADYRSARAAGREVTRGQADPQSLSLLQRLEALDADWEELGRVWEKRQRLLAQAVAFHVFLRDAKQVEGTLGKQEHTLAHTEMPGTVPGAEAAVRRLEEFLAALDTGTERVRALTDTGRKLLEEGGVHAEKVRETVESVESRSYEGTRDLQGKWQKHQAFAAELAANRGWLEALEKDGEQLARARPALAGQVTAPRQELRALWAQVEAAAAAKGRGLAEAARAESCAQACAGLRSWLAGVRAQLRSGHCGQDLTSVGVLLTRHQDEPGAQAMLSRHLGLEQELRDYGGTVELLAEQGRAMAASGHPDGERLRARAAQLQRLYAGLCHLAEERRATLQGHHRLCQLRRDLDDLEQWISEREVVAASRELGQDFEHVTEGAVAAAWAELRGRCQRRRRLLGDSVEQFRFLRAARDLRLWMDGVHLQLQLSQELAELQERRRDIGERWQDKLEWLQTVLEVLVFGRDAATAEAWLASREPLARAPELGSSLAEAETLLKRHQSFQKAAAAWDERGAQEGGPGPGGGAATLPPRAPPQPETLEGTLSRKQELEAAGKRAANRSWQSLYCVLRGGVLSVFKDARGAGAGVPWHGEPPAPLRGARCQPATAYRKRKHADMALWLRGIEAAAGAALGPGGPREGPGVPGGPPKGMSRALSLPPVPPPAEGAPRAREPKEREKRFSFFKKNK